MYEAFYGLNEKPFNLTPDPRFLYLSDKHREAFAHLLYGIKNRAGFVMVSGEVGAGKTTICRTLIGKLDENTEVAFIFNPFLSATELLRKINEEFGISTRGNTNKDLIDELNAYLLEQYRQGKNCVLIIDEAQDLEPTVLEQIRLLSNLETETQKLLQIVLIGQPELMEKLALPELRQLNQRITARYHLMPLNYKETVLYIANRLRVAGGRGRVKFTKRSLKGIYRESGGTPRVINALCDRALLIGFTRESRELSWPIVRQAVKEVRGETRRARRRERRPIAWGRWLRPMAAALALLLLTAGVALAVPFVKPSYELFQAWAQSQVDRMAKAEAAEQQPEEQAPAAERVGPAEEPPTPAAMAEPVPPPSPLAKYIDAIPPRAARNAAAVALVRAWGLEPRGDYPDDDGVDNLASFGAVNGMRVAPLEPVTLEQLEYLGLPAMVRLLGDEQVVWAALLSMKADEVRLSTRFGQSTAFPRADFAKRFGKEAVVFYAEHEGASPVGPWARGDNVRRIQQTLADLELFDEEPDGVYSESTREAVRRLQARAGLKTDGVVGPHTRLALAAASGAEDVPLLRPRPTHEEPQMAETASETGAADGGVIEVAAVQQPAPAVETEDQEEPSVQEPPSEAEDEEPVAAKVLPEEEAALDAESAEAESTEAADEPEAADPEADAEEPHTNDDALAEDHLAAEEAAPPENEDIVAEDGPVEAADDDVASESEQPAARDEAPASDQHAEPADEEAMESETEPPEATTSDAADADGDAEEDASEEPVDADETSPADAQPDTTDVAPTDDELEQPHGNEAPADPEAVDDASKQQAAAADAKPDPEISLNAQGNGASDEEASEEDEGAMAVTVASERAESEEAPAVDAPETARAAAPVAKEPVNAGEEDSAEAASAPRKLPRAFLGWDEPVDAVTAPAASGLPIVPASPEAGSGHEAER